MPVNNNNNHSARVVHLLDGELAVRSELERVLRAAGYELHVFESASEYLQLPRPQSPVCLVLHLTQPVFAGYEVLRTLHRRDWPVGVVLLITTGDGTPGFIGAMQLEAVDFLEGPMSEGDLLPAIQMAFERAAARHASARAYAQTEARFHRLTPRERQVCELVTRGLLNKQIAAELGLAERTIKQHRGAAMRKLQVGSVPDLVRIVDRFGRDPASQDRY